MLTGLCRVEIVREYVHVLDPQVRLNEVENAWRTTRMIPGSLARGVVAGQTCNLHAASPDLWGARIIDRTHGEM